MERTITVTLPPSLYDLAQATLIDSGFFSDFEDVVKTGVRRVLLEWSIPEQVAASPNLTGPERYMFYLNKLRREIAAAGGLFPDKSNEEVIEILRQTREQLYEEKYAAHFRHQ